MPGRWVGREENVILGPSNFERVLEIHRLKEKGMSIQAIATYMDMSRQNVSYHLNRNHDLIQRFLFFLSSAEKFSHDPNVQPEVRAVLADAALFFSKLVTE